MAFSQGQRQFRSCFHLCVCSSQICRKKVRWLVAEATRAKVHTREGTFPRSGFERLDGDLEHFLLDFGVGREPLQDLVRHVDRLHEPLRLDTRTLKMREGCMGKLFTEIF